MPRDESDRREGDCDASAGAAVACGRGETGSACELCWRELERQQRGPLERGRGRRGYAGSAGGRHRGGTDGAPAAAAEAASKKERASRAKSIGRDTAKIDALPEPDAKAAGKDGKRVNKKYTLHGLNFQGLGAVSQHVSDCSLCPKPIRAAAKT